MVGQEVVPDNRKPYFVHNATAGGFAVTVKTAAGAGVAVGVSPDNTAVVYCDGPDMLAISAGTAGGDGGAGALIELGDPRGGRQLRPPCHRRRQRLDQGVRRRL